MRAAKPLPHLKTLTAMKEKKIRTASTNANEKSRIGALFDN
jgi:hypothetical protein